MAWNLTFFVLSTEEENASIFKSCLEVIMQSYFTLEIKAISAKPPFSEGQVLKEFHDGETEVPATSY